MSTTCFYKAIGSAMRMGDATDYEQRIQEELARAGLDTRDPAQIEESLRLLKEPRIEVNRLPPDNPSRPGSLRHST